MCSTQVAVCVCVCLCARASHKWPQFLVWACVAQQFMSGLAVAILCRWVVGKNTGPLFVKGTNFTPENGHSLEH